MDFRYHTDDLVALIEAVDFVSLHTYAFHDSHYNADYWLAPERRDRTLRRLGDILGAERARLVVVLLLTVGSVGLTVIGPRLLGQATDGELLVAPSAEKLLVGSTPRSSARSTCSTMAPWS